MIVQLARFTVRSLQIAGMLVVAILLAQVASGAAPPLGASVLGVVVTLVYLGVRRGLRRWTGDAGFRLLPRRFHR